MLGAMFDAAPRRTARAPACVALLALALTACRAEPTTTVAFEPIDWVDARIGSGGAGYGQGQAFPGATRPFGMVKPGPDTSGPLLGDLGFAHTAGYWYPDDTIFGFSQTHLHGTGVEDYGHVLVMPATGERALATKKDDFAQPFDHADELVRPGYYAVTLGADRTRVELTATRHAALHRYTYAPGAASPSILVDLGHGMGRDAAPDAALDIDPSTGEISGWLDSAGRFTGASRAFRVYFSLVPDVAPVEHGVVEARRRTSGGVRATGGRAGAFLRFEARQVVVTIGISLIDVASARANRATGAIGFEAARAEAEAEWRGLLDRVVVEGAPAPLMRAFYSALYRSFLLPTELSEADGRYVGLDRAIGRADGFRYLTDLSLWDTYRTLHPLYTLIAPDAQADVARSLIAMGRAHGALPRWPLAVNETGTMLGSPATIVLAESAAKGIELDEAAAFEAALADAEYRPGRTIRGNHSACVELGFCPADEMNGSVARAVEFGWADFALSTWAARRGDTRTATTMAARAPIFAAHFDAGSRFLRGRSRDGRWVDVPEDRTEWTEEFVEGNAWHYLFSAMYGVPALAEAFGGVEPLLARLDELFELSERTPTPIAIQEGQFEGPHPYYWHGNEPDLHAAFVYALAGAPDRGARWIRWVQDSQYTDLPDGLAGNDDAGTLSAWLVLSSLGLYPLAGSELWLLSAPRFDRAVLKTAAGRLVIEATGAGPYVVGVRLDGQPITRPWLRHRQLLGPEVRLVIERAEAPAGWGAGPPLDPLRPE
jgi:predicted alpha-1,2-mannosidase